MNEFFISYSRKDSELIEPLIEVLDQKEVPYFVDRRKIDYGASYADEIVAALYETKRVLFIWTENSDKADWVDKEIQYSINNKIPIVPIKIGEFRSGGMRLALSNINWCEIDELNYEKAEEIIDRYLHNPDEESQDNGKRKKISVRKYIKNNKIKKKEFDVDVFLSCDISRVNLAKRIARRLKNRGVKTFIDVNGSKKNKDQALKLGKILSSSRVMLLLWDKALESYPLVNSELNYARGLDKDIVAYKFAGFESEGEFDNSMENAKVYQGEGIDKKVLLRLISYIEKLIPTEEKEEDLRKNMQEALLGMETTEEKEDEEFFNAEEIKETPEEDDTSESEEPEDFEDEENEDETEADIVSEEDDENEEDDIYKLKSIEKFQELIVTLISLPSAVVKDIVKIVKIVSGIRDRKKKRKKIKKRHLKTMKRNKRLQKRKR